jgi:hypothetical protein
MGITQKALAAGVPVCVIPFGRDQLEVARHVEIAGAGTRVSVEEAHAGTPEIVSGRATGRHARGLRRGRHLLSTFEPNQ